MTLPLECRNLACGYDGKSVLQDINLQVRPGEAVALLGPNGSGKSTLLKALTKTLVPQSGEVLLGGQSVAKLSHMEVARRASFVPQEEANHFPFLVRDVVTMGRIAHSRGLLDSNEDKQAATEAMREADCLHLEDRVITQLSGGERQRVLIARALAQEAPLVLLDEPTAHLDVGHQLAVADLVRRLASQERAVLAAVHDLNLASSFATRAILLVSGRIALDDRVEDVLRSTILDEVYGVRFQRLTLEDGRLALVPALALGV